MREKCRIRGTGIQKKRWEKKALRGERGEGKTKHRPCTGRKSSRRKKEGGKGDTKKSRARGEAHEKEGSCGLGNLGRKDKKGREILGDI